MLPARIQIDAAIGVVRVFVTDQFAVVLDRKDIVRFVRRDRLGNLVGFDIDLVEAESALRIVG